MAGCCTPSEHSRFFNRTVAAKDARRYRRRGLTGTAQRLVELAGDVSGESILDVGGGIGAIGLELLAAGAARATDVELSDAYETEAELLLAEQGLRDRVERRIGDFVGGGASLPAHDVVVLHRVVCCYPDVDGLVGEAAAHARRVVVLTYPQERWFIRAGTRVLNLYLLASRCGFRTYAHPVERIVTAAGRHGLVLEARERHGLLWESAAFARP